MLKTILRFPRKCLRRLNEAGVAAIEMAIILPALALMVVGGLELSLMMLKDISIQRYLAALTNEIQISPSSVTLSSVGNDNYVNAYGIGTYTICGKSFRTLPEARADACDVAAGGGGSVLWQIAPNPTWDPNAPYYVKIRLTTIGFKSLTPIADKYIKNIDKSTIFKVTPIIGIPAHGVTAFNLPDCPAGWSRFNQAIDRNIIGAGGKYGFGATGGSDSYTLSLKQMPRHNHDMILTGSNVLVKVNNRSDNHGDESSVAFRTAGSSDKLHTSYDGGNCDDDKRCNDPYGSMDPYVALTYCEKN